MMRAILLAMLLAGPAVAQDVTDDELLQSMLDQPHARSAAPRHEEPQQSIFATLGGYEGERDNGGNKVCIYNKFGQTSVITVPLVSACPR